jgi:hypothetical protein
MQSQIDKNSYVLKQYINHLEVLPMEQNLQRNNYGVIDVDK